MKRFQDKVVIVTGASSGLGQAACFRLAEEGAKLVLVSLAQEEDKLKSTENSIKEIKNEFNFHREENVIENIINGHINNINLQKKITNSKISHFVYKDSPK